MTLSSNNEQKEQYSNNFFSSNLGRALKNSGYTETRVAGTSSMLARSGIPYSHIRIADNYMIIKRIYGFPLVQSKIEKEEKELLLKYDFNVLEYTTFKQMEEELAFLKKWSNSKNDQLATDADKILEIRCKELKSLIATNFVNINNKNYNGAIALDMYFANISKYFRAVK